jgi:hypothetical protein
MLKSMPVWLLVCLVLAVAVLVLCGGGRVW